MIGCVKRKTGPNKHSNPLTKRSQAGKESHCQLEVDIVYDRLVAHQPGGKWNKLAPLRILSFDIECQVRVSLPVHALPTGL